MTEPAVTLSARALLTRALLTGTLSSRALTAADPITRRTAGVFPAGAATRGAPRVIAVDLHPCNAQPGNAVPLDPSLPCDIFLHRQIVEPADLGQLDGPATDGLDNHC